MVYNGILMQTIGISVMVSIGLLLVFLAGEILFHKLTRQSQVTNGRILSQILSFGDYLKHKPWRRHTNTLTCS